MAQYKTPGVYVEEKNSFGSSIVANATAVPVFIGFTEAAKYPNGKEVQNIKDSDNVKEPVLVRSMLEYQQTFGGPDTTGTIAVLGDRDPVTGAITYSAKNKNNDGTNYYTPGLMHPSVANFFSNGGGSCYIVSLGSYSQFKKSETKAVNLDFIKKAIELAEQATLILPTDLIRYGKDDYYTWGTDLTNYSQIEKKYFCVLDVIQENPNRPVYDETDITYFREKVSPEFPSYAAAYFPYLKSLTAYAYKSDLSNVYLDGYPVYQDRPSKYRFEGSVKKGGTVYATFTYKSNEKAPYVNNEQKTFTASTKSIVVEDNQLTITYDETSPSTKNTKESLRTEWNGIKSKYPQWTLTFKEDLTDGLTNYKVTTSQIGVWKATNPPTDSFPFIVTCFKIDITNNIASDPKNDIEVKVESGSAANIEVKSDGINVTILNNQEPANQLSNLIKTSPVTDHQLSIKVNPSFTGIFTTTETDTIKLTPTENATLESIKTFLSTYYINMPPSPFMAGIYSRLDNATGVWTPPGNVAPAGVRGPLVALTSKQQEDLNVSTTGKSINAIRSFTGKGTLVWGARTIDGNSLDWRYVNVRRLFISMETDISKALEAFVFKPNVHNTWVEVKTMIDSYLFGLFNDGAFAGLTPETSYQVLIGVGETMTDEDVLNGYMRASIRVAPVRPAEFIVLTFSQMIGQ